MEPLIRKIARFSRVSLAIITLLGLLALTLAGLLGEKILRGQVEQRLASALGRPVKVGGLSVDVPRRVVELRDVLIPGREDSKRPTLIAPRVRLALSFRSLFTSRILLRALELERPQLSVQVFPDGSTDLPQVVAPQGASSRTVSLGRVSVSAGDLFLNDQPIPVEISWPNFEAALARDAESLLQGTVSAGPGPMRFGDLPAEDARFDLAIRLADSVLHIDQGSLSSAGTHLSMVGDIDLHQEPKGRIQLSGPFDLNAFDRSVAGTTLRLQGLPLAKGTLSIDGDRMNLEGTMAGRDGSYDSIPVQSFATEFSFDGSDFQLRNLAIEALGGRATLSLDVPAKTAIRVVGVVETLRAESLLHWLFDYGTARLGSRVSGPIDFQFPRGAASLLNGSGDLTLTADPAEGDPLSGRFPFSAKNGLVTMTGVQLEGPRTRMAVDGSIGTDQQVNLSVSVLSEDLVVTDALGARLRVAFGALDPKPLGATGHGRFEGRVSGTLGEPLFAGRFIGAGVGYLGVLWGDVDWTGEASPVELKSHPLIAVRRESRVDLRGAQRLGAAGVDDAMDLTILIEGWPASDLLHVVAAPMDIAANVTGTIHALGSRSRPLGEADLVTGPGKAFGVDFEKGALDLEFQGEALGIRSLEASLGGGSLRVAGTLTGGPEASAFDGEVEVRDVELADLGLQTVEPVIGGRISGRATLSGPLEKPRVTAMLTSTRIFYGDEGIGALELHLEGSGDGTLHIRGQSDSPRFQATVTGSIEAKAPHASRLEIDLEKGRIDPVLRALGSRFENAVVITASARARVEGPLLEPDSITAQVSNGRLRVAVPEYAIEAAPGFVIELEKSALRIAGLTLTGEGTSLAVSGRLALKSDDQNDLAVTGRADLRVLSGFSRDWRARGSATLRSQISGTPSAPRISGGLDVEDGALRLRTFPQGLDQLNGRVVFNETQARFAGLEGRFGGGRVSVSGQVGFGGEGPASFDLSFNGSGLGLRYPEGLRSTFDAALRLQGTAESHWLTGELQVSKALWTRRYAITSELFGSESDASTFGRAASGLTTSPMHLDIAIKAPGTLRLDNNLASLVARADLTLTGSPSEPQLLGRLEVERGKVFFGGNTYEVRKGVAVFSNPREINPVFDIEADTRLRQYRLTLQANGTLDRVSTRITSDPPLTSPQIASILTGGDENDVANIGGSVNDLQTLGTGGLNSFASTWLDDNLTGRVAQGFGLSRLSIDPGKGLLSRTGSRLTVGKRVAQDLEVVYSRNIFGGAESQLATAEYSLSNRFSLVVSWAEPGGFGADVRTRITLDR